jgi:hypothetical protein
MAPDLCQLTMKQRKAVLRDFDQGLLLARLSDVSVPNTSTCVHTYANIGNIGLANIELHAG